MNINSNVWRLEFLDWTLGYLQFEMFQVRGSSHRTVHKKERVSYFYRTATTSYLCYVPVLED